MKSGTIRPTDRKAKCLGVFSSQKATIVVGGGGGCKIDTCKWKPLLLYKVNALNYEIGMGESYSKI